jgi:fluoride ion exporter CrcB/FEX
VNAFCYVLGLGFVGTLSWHSASVVGLDDCSDDEAMMLSVGILSVGWVGVLWLVYSGVVGWRVWKAATEKHNRPWKEGGEGVVGSIRIQVE